MTTDQKPDQPTEKTTPQEFCQQLIHKLSTTENWNELDEVGRWDLVARMSREILGVEGNYIILNADMTIWELVSTK